MKLRSGVRLGPYEVLELLGRGGMGEVWKARDTRLDRLVAVKRLSDHTERFEREARAIAALNHPHICQIYDVGPDYLVLEFIEGVTLADHVVHRQKGPAVGVEDSVHLAIQIASALEEAHRHHILHRDLKPANIMVIRGGSGPAAKILDFGIAKLATADVDVTQTAANTILGTAAFMSPEQARGRPLDARSDIFSFGSVMYEMFSGRRAFDGASTMDVLIAVISVDPPPLEVPPELERIVRRCLEKAPEHRFESAGDIRVALEHVLKHEAQRPAAEHQPSIAVLPFTNISPDKENEYFGDGLAEEIIGALAQIPGLKVTARTSAFAFRDKVQDITEIARALRVRTVLEGSVRRSGNRIRVTAQLINAADGYHLWSDRYDREMTEAFAIQDEIAHAIAASLQGRLARDTPVRRTPPNPAAYEAYLKARYYMGQLQPDALSRSHALLEQAIALDPGFALARLQRSQYFLVQAFWGGKSAHEMMPLARASALEAIAADPSLSAAHAILGVVAGFYDYDWDGQDHYFRAALAREPVASDVRAHHGIHCLLVSGRAHDAVQEMKRALEGDPLNLVIRVQLAVCLDAAGEIVEAEAELKQTLELNDQCGPAAEWLGVLCAFRGRFPEAAGYVEHASAVAGRQTRFTGLLAGIMKQCGDADRAQRLLVTLGTGETPGAPVELMFFHLLESNIDAAADWAEKAIAQRDPYLLVLLSTVVGAPFRSSPRWPRLARLMNLQ